MVNNYYIGDIHHNKTIKKDAYTEKLVLYSDDKYFQQIYFIFIFLINDINYTTDNNKKAYVLEETLVEIDIRDFREDYNYLLSRHNDKKKTKKKHWYNRQG